MTGMKWQPTRFTTMREFDFTNILIGIVSLAGAVFIHVISPNFYRATGIPEIMFMLVMIGIAVLLFGLRAGYRDYRGKYGSAHDTKHTEETK